MAKLYFKYGTMGSSKTAQALMCRFNYVSKGFDVLMIKPDTDSRDVVNGKIVVKSRIGLQCDCEVFTKNTNLYDLIENKTGFNVKSVVIVDECQFCKKEQVEQLHKVSEKIPVLCYGLLTNYKTELFEGSKRLVEIAESLMEIKSVCECGKKATINAKIIDGKVVKEGEEVSIGNMEYKSMCYKCYLKHMEN